VQALEGFDLRFGDAYDELFVEISRGE